MLRVGRIIYGKGKRVIPSYPGFTPVIVMTKSSEYGSLGPYVLKDTDGRIMENIWQFSKVYNYVPKVEEKYSKYDDTVIWAHPKEFHLKDGGLTDEYRAWREKGMKCKYPVRYPVGYRHRGQCKYALADDSLEKLDYVAARKAIYLPVYVELVKNERQFDELKCRLESGENLLIIEVDGPHSESLDYYKREYGVNDDFIEESTILATEENLDIMLNDPKHPFGHGYCLAVALLDISYSY